MKLKTLPVKRRPVSKGIFRRLSAVTRNRKQRVAATVPASEMDADDGSSKISRALTIIFMIHIVAIGLIFFHQHFLDGRPVEKSTTTKAAVVATASTPVVQRLQGDLPQLSGGEKIHIVKAGDNYARIAAAQEVDEAELRKLNKQVEIQPGLILQIPPKRIVAEDPPEVTAIRQQTPADHERGLVEAVDIANAPKAQLVRSNTVVPAAAASGTSYVVQSGDSIWRIANRFKVNQDALMRANGITDARKMKTGMKLTIP